MAIDLTYDPHVEELFEASRKFVRGYDLSIEEEHFGNITDGGGDVLCTRIQATAREAGVFAPCVPVEYGATDWT